MEVPTTTCQAEEDGWLKTEQPSDIAAPYSELVMYCIPPLKSFCGLYDVASTYIVGGQISVSTRSTSYCFTYR